MPLFKKKVVENGDYHVVMGEQAEIPIYEVKCYDDPAAASIMAQGVADFLNEHVADRHDTEGHDISFEGKLPMRCSISVSIHLHTKGADA